ncbi:MAG: PD-(D/E)XK nuclease family protein [Treponema sp.]|nr:PD-(D/E)XK nuclease family protein [Treponema sp.]
MEYNSDVLSRIHSILKKYKEQEERSGTNISILKVTGKDHSEVVICRLIAFLLNPKEMHKQGSKFLNLFLTEIGEKPVQQDEEFTVATEYQTDGKRRIDIVLKSNKRFIPFEVKIYATDQKEQCAHYYHFAHKRYNAEKVFYLTPDEHKPDESSVGDLKLGSTLQLITFREHVLQWLEKCESDTAGYTPILIELIRELKIAIRKFCGLEENKEMSEEILKEIMKDDNSLEAAKTIYAVGKEINGSILWEEFCKGLKPNWPEDFHQFNYSEEYESNNALTVSLAEQKVYIHFHALFSYIDIDIQDDKALAEKIQNALKDKYNNFDYTDITDMSNGFQIYKTKEYFTGNSVDNPFDIYILFKNNKDEVFKKMQEFIEYIDIIIDE